MAVFNVSFLFYSFFVILFSYMKVTVYFISENIAGVVQILLVALKTTHFMKTGT